MDLNFEYRKRRYLEKIADEYAPVKKKWWQDRRPEYVLTKEYAERSKRTFSLGETVLVKNSVLGPVVLCLVFIVVFLLFYFTIDKKEWIYISGCIGLILMMIFLPRALSRKDKLRISKEEFWYYKKFVNIQWQYVLSTYIKIMEVDESKSYYLIVHYYDDAYDEFRSVEISLDGLEIEADEMAAIIEKFKISRNA